MRTLWMLVLVGCGGGSGPEGCSGADRDACLVERLPAVFREDEARGEALAETIEDGALRDLLWLTLTRDVDPTREAWCARIASPPLGERCRAIVSRPHLQPIREGR